MPILNSINQMQEEMKEWRRDLHRIPEIGLQEYKTSEFIQNKLKSWNIDFKTGYANTGIVAWVKGNRGTSEKTIGLRADFDALPMTEKNSFDHKSMNEGMMHAGRNVDVIDIRALFDIGHDLPHIFDLEIAWPERRRINAISDEFVIAHCPAHRV